MAAAADFNDYVSIMPRYQYGSGVYYRGKVRPRIGAGVGTFLLNFFRPFVKKGMHSVVDVASKVASDAIDGVNVKESFKKHAAAKVGEMFGNVSKPVPAEKNVSQSPISSPLAELSKGQRVIAARSRNVSKVKKHSTVTGTGKRKRISEASCKERKKKVKHVGHVKEASQYPALRYM